MTKVAVVELFFRWTTNRWKGNERWIVHKGFARLHHRRNDPASNDSPKGQIDHLLGPTVGREDEKKEECRKGKQKDEGKGDHLGHLATGKRRRCSVPLIRADTVDAKEKIKGILAEAILKVVLVVANHRIETVLALSIQTTLPSSGKVRLEGRCASVLNRAGVRIVRPN